MPERYRNFRSPILFVDRVSVPQPEQSDQSLSIELHGVRDPLGGPNSGGVLTFHVGLDQIGSRGVRAERNDDVRSDQLLAEVLRGMHTRPEEALYTLFRRCCFALMPALLAPIGFCIAEFASQRGRVMALVLSLIPLGMFYLGEILGARLLLSTRNPWCGWLPAVLLGVIGTPLVWRQMRR
jgi:hypothetical protein